jgi:Domain of unknown function (DUF222)/HNH endonuclease
MCDTGQRVTVEAALAMLDRALDALNATDMGALPAAVQAEALRGLERAEAKHTAARSGVLAAFTAQSGYTDDGQGSARLWLKWQTRVTRGAAAASMAWLRRLTAHPQIGQALAAGEISRSWAREFCDANDRLPADRREDADDILLAAARAGADLPGLMGLAWEMYQRSRSGQPDTGDRFDDRYLRLGITFGGAGRCEGDLTPGCAAALSAVVDALAKKAGPEDTRTAAQRRHDALEDACRRLIASGMLPARAGQPTQAQLHITLAQLRGLPGASAAEAAWRAAAAREYGWLSGPEADTTGCDATFAPVVTGHIDPAALDRLVAVLLGSHPGTAVPPGTSLTTATAPAPGTSLTTATAPAPGTPLPGPTLDRVRGAVLAMAADVLSGPGGLAAWLRSSALAGGPGATPSLPLGVPLPLDLGETEPAIPAYLRRAVASRHPHCAFPGCDQPVSVCQVHHLIPRADGGPTTLANLVPLCSFHHLIVIHRWGWALVLHPDGSTTATSPDRARVLHSHGPPGRAA